LEYYRNLDEWNSEFRLLLEYLEKTIGQETYKKVITTATYDHGQEFGICATNRYNEKMRRAWSPTCGDAGKTEEELVAEIASFVNMKQTRLPPETRNE